MLRRGQLASVWIAWLGLVAGSASFAEDPPPSGTREAEGASGLRLYYRDHFPSIFARLNYGFDRDEFCLNGTTACSADSTCAPPNDVCGARVDDLTPGTQATIWDLVCDPDPGDGHCRTHSWDFSGNNLTTIPTLKEIASTTTRIDSDETCSYAACGFRRGRCEDGSGCVDASHCGGIGTGACHVGQCPDGITFCSADAACLGIGDGACAPFTRLGREDKNFLAATPLITLNAIEGEVRGCNVAACTAPGVPTACCTGLGTGSSDATIWLRGAVRFEGATGGLGSGESRLCYDPETGRTEVPLYRFPHHDGTDHYFQLGDSWSSDRDGNPGNGVQPFACENDVFNGVCPTCGAFCPLYVRNCTGFSGTQSSTVVNEGTVTLPSGHTFEAAVVRSVAEFCVWLSGSCGAFTVDNVRTVNYLWEVPKLGTVVRLQSHKTAGNLTAFTTLAEVDIKFGLFPPRSVTPGAVTNTTVELSWDPGLDTHRVDGYRVYWSTEAGAYDPVDSVVTASNSAVIPGLVPGTTYHLTVSSMSEYTDPATGVATTYESLLFPRQAPGVPTALPVEVSATTACAEIENLRVNRSGSNVELSWDDSSDPAVIGYQVLGAPSPQSDNNFSVLVADTGAATSVSLPNPASAYYLVVGVCAGGTGKWGHYGR